MKKRLICAAVLAIAVLIIPGCSKSNGATYNKAEISQSQVSDNMGYDSKLSTSVKDNGVIGSELKNDSQIQKKIIQTGDIRITVEDLKKTSSDIRGKINEFGGYIESENLSELSSNSRIRVPSEKLQVFVEYIESTYETQGKNFSSQDITDVYVDNEARMKNFKVQETQILEIMKKANSVEDILKVQNELSRIRGEIESLESRKKVWDKEVDFSSINIIANKKQTAIDSKVKALTGSEFIKSIGKGFKNSTTGLLLFIQNIIIFFISNILIISIIAAASFFMYKKYLKYKIKK